MMYHINIYYHIKKQLEKVGEIIFPEFRIQHNVLHILHTHHRMLRVGTIFWLKIGETEEIFSGELISNFKKTI